MDKESLINRRKNNSKIKACVSNQSASTLKRFLELNQNKKFDLSNWNCQDYAAALWHCVAK